MARRRRRALEREEAIGFVVHDARSGEIVALHSVIGMEGVPAPDVRTVEHQVLKCTARAYDRKIGELKAVTAPEMPSGNMSESVNVESGAIVGRASAGGTGSVEPGTVLPGHADSP
jgi:hypothetical protein